MTDTATLHIIWYDPKTQKPMPCVTMSSRYYQLMLSSKINQESSLTSEIWCWLSSRGLIFYVWEQIFEQASNTLYHKQIKTFHRKLCHGSGISLRVGGQLTPEIYSRALGFPPCILNLKMKAHFPLLRNAWAMSICQESHAGYNILISIKYVWHLGFHCRHIRLYEVASRVPSLEGRHQWDLYEGGTLKPCDMLQSYHKLWPFMVI